MQNMETNKVVELVKKHRRLTAHRMNINPEKEEHGAQQLEPLPLTSFVFLLALQLC